jgi:hypothetical protein
LFQSENPDAPEAIELFVKHIFNGVDFRLKDRKGKSVALSYLRNGSNSVSSQVISDHCPLIHHLQALFPVMSYLSFGAISLRNIREPDDC